MDLDCLGRAPVRLRGAPRAAPRANQWARSCSRARARRRARARPSSARDDGRGGAAMMLFWALLIAVTAFGAGSILTVRILVRCTTVYRFWLRVFERCDFDTRVL